MEQESFLMRKEWEQHIDMLSKEQRGDLLTLIFAYQNKRELPDCDPMAKLALSFMRPFFEDSAEKYAERVRKNQENGKLGGRPKNQNNPVVFLETQPNQSKPNVTLSNVDTDTDSDSVPYEGENRAGKPRPTPKGLDRKNNATREKHGQYGWVQLTEEEHSRLLNDLGEPEFKRCVAYIDESAQSTGNKNHWRDWNLVVRKCSREGWGLSGNKAKTPQSGYYGSGEPSQRDIDSYESLERYLKKIEAEPLEPLPKKTGG